MKRARATLSATTPPRAGPSAKFERKREHILDAATILLNQKGVAGMTMQEVAQQLGLKTTAVTYYFRYKEDLVVAVFEDSLERLGGMVDAAGHGRSAYERVDRYLKIHFDHYAASLRGEARPLAILSEMRALDSTVRQRLLSRYQAIFRDVRAFFGDTDSADQKRRLTARAQLLNEAIFWSALWLRQFAVTDYDTVRRQMMQIFHRGIARDDAGVEPAFEALDDGRDMEDSYHAFLKAATRSVNEIGYKGTSIDRIAAGLNLTKGSFYHHLDTKDDLIIACFRESFDRLCGLNERAGKAGRSKWETILFIIANALRIQLESDFPLLRTTAFQALPADSRNIAYDYSQSTVLSLALLIVDACQEGFARNINPLLASHIIMSTINSAFDMRSWAARQDMADAVMCYLQCLTRGILQDAED